MGARPVGEALDRRVLKVLDDPFSVVVMAPSLWAECSAGPLKRLVTVRIIGRRARRLTALIE
jgi:hypothetical protein